MPNCDKGFFSNFEIMRLTLKKIGTSIAVFILLLQSFFAQTPTHIDQGTNDNNVRVSDDIGYLLLIIGLLALLVFSFLLIRHKLNKNKAGEEPAQKQ